MKYDIIIIGAGPAGYVAAIRAAQLGMKTALVEKEKTGGMCLNWGCIPTKALIESGKFYAKMGKAAEFGIDGINVSALRFNWNNAVKRAAAIVRKLSGGIDYLLKKNGVDLIAGEAKITSAGSVTVKNRSHEAKHIIVATGSAPEPIKGFENAPVIELRDLMLLEKLPPDILIIGKGAIAAEMAQFLSMTGVKVSMLIPDTILVPGLDDYINDYLLNKLKKDGVKLFITPEAPVYKKGSVVAGAHTLTAKNILNCSIRRAVLPESVIPIEKTEEGFLKTDFKFESSVPGIYAVGDVNGMSYLAHVASAQGIWVVNAVKGIRKEFDLKKYPLNIYSAPEIAQVGYTEQMLRAEGMDYKLSEFPLTANGKALTEGSADGLIRLLSDKKYGQVLGVQIIAEHATDMISEASAYLQIEGTIYDVAQTIHAHPTVSEIFMEAGFDAIDRAIHK